MASVTGDLDILAQVDSDQCVWFGTGRESAKNSGLSPEKFAAEDWVLNGRSVKLAGDWDNASLIRRLWDQKLSKGSATRIYLGRPPSCEDPADTICRLRNLTSPASCGGWHLMTGHDYVTYKLIEELEKSRPGFVTQSMFLCLRAHPAYPALSFLPRLAPWWAAVFLAYVVDPRWHINSKFPDRTSTYYRMLGLSGGGATKALWRHYVSQAAPEAYGLTSTAKAWAVSGGLTANLGVGPRHFLTHIWSQYRDERQGLLVACRLFARFVRDVWLDGFTPPREYRKVEGGSRMVPAKTYSPQLFVPEHFFSDPEIVEAWVAHTKDIHKSSD